MARVFFLFVGEGSSDNALVTPLRDLCLYCGAHEADGFAPDLAALPKKVGPTVQDKLRAARTLEPNANLIFVHQDADSSDFHRRQQEIEQARQDLACKPACVAVVPVQATEAWLLLNEAEIRRVAGNPWDGPPWIFRLTIGWSN